MTIQEQIEKSEEDLAHYARMQGTKNSPEWVKVLDWHRNSIKSILEGLVEREKKVSKDNRLPKKLPNPFYPKEGEPFFKMEGNINFMEGYDLKSNDTISHLQSLIKEL